MDWWNWIVENIGEIWEAVVIVAGLALYLAKKNKDGLLGDVWKDVKAKLAELAKEALQEVSEADVHAIAGPFWDNRLADIKIIHLFISKERFLDFCWDQWLRFVDTESEVDVAVAQRTMLGSMAFNA